MAGDPWAAFDGVPAAGGAGAPAAAADPWAAFDGVPSASAPVANAVPASAAPVLQPGQRTGMMANIGAGLQGAGAAAVNAASDPVGYLIGKPAVALGTGAYNLGARVFGYDKLSPEKMNALLDDGPGPGDRLVASLNRAGGAPLPSDVVPGSDAERYVRAGIEGAAGMAMLGPMGGARAAAGTLSTGTLSGLGAQAAQDALPADLAPAGSVLAGIAAPMAPHVAIAGVRGVVNPVRNALADYATPAAGRAAPVLNEQGLPMVGSNEQVVSATPGQARMAGQALNQAASDPVAARAAAATVVESVPGENPTTFQATRDAGLGMLEAQVSRGGPAERQAAFVARAAQQNDARVGVLRQVGGDGTPAALPAEAVRQADALDARTAADVQARQATADRAVQQAGALTQARTAAQEAAARQAADAMGGNLPAGSDAQVGAAVRAPVDAANQAAKTQERAAWNAIDPDGTLGVSMAPIKAGAQDILGEMSPNAAPPVGNEAGIFQTASHLPEVQSFRDLGALRSRLTDAIRQERGPQGDPQAVRRMSMLLDRVHQSMDAGFQGDAAAAQAAKAGGMSEATAAQKQGMEAARDAWYADRDAAARTTAQSAAADGGSAGRDAASGPGGVPPVGGSQVPPRGQLGAAAGGQDVQGGTPLGITYDQAAADRYAGARQATRDRAETFKDAPGVGTILQGGPTAGTFRTPDSAVPNIIVKVGPQGADTARAYLAAGGSPQALSDAAAFSVRQAATNADGTLDPARIGSWMRQRQSFLSQAPEAAARFQAVADAHTALQEGRTGAAATLKGATKLAQDSVNEATARRATAIKDNQRSALGQFTGDAEPSARIGQMLSDKVGGAASIAQLVDSVKANPDALAGARAAAADYIQRELIGNTRTAAGEEAGIKADRFQTFMKASAPALEVLMTPEQMTGLRSVAASLERTNLRTQVGVGSPTAQYTAGRFNSLLTTVGGKLASYGAAGAGGAAGSVFGPGGTMLGSLAGKALGDAVQAAREAGLQNVEHLKAEALLNPALYRALTANVTPQNQASLMAGLTAQLRRTSLVSASRAGQQDDRRRQ